jgi:hypothetical protein
VRRARIVRQDASPRENHPELIENNVIQAIDLFGGAKRDRTADLLNAIQALSQLSYGPTGGPDDHARVAGI